jgi:hypothetical protein
LRLLRHDGFQKEENHDYSRGAEKGRSGIMDLSPLPPPYPWPSVNDPEEPIGDRDWGVLVCNLIFPAMVSGLLAVLVTWIAIAMRG